MTFSSAFVVEGLSKAVNNQVLSDVTFIVGRKREKIYAHKSILCFTCEYFQKMFCNGMSESGMNHITLPDIEPEEFLAVMNFLYTGELQDNSMTSPDTVLGVLELADRYQIIPLREFCLNYISKNITLECVCLLMEKAIMYSSEELKKSCLSFIENNTSEVFNSDCMFLLSSEALAEILKSDRLNAKEIEIFHAVTKWIEENKQQGSQSLEEVLRYIRFPLMTSEELVAIENTKQIPKDILYEAFKYKACPHLWHTSDHAPFQYRGRRISSYRFNSEAKSPNVTVSSNGMSVVYDGYATRGSVLSSEGVTSGIHIWTLKIESSDLETGVFVGIASRGVNLDGFIGSDNKGWSWSSEDGRKHHESILGRWYGEKYTCGDFIDVELDMNRHMLEFSKNGKNMGQAFWDLPEAEMYLAVTLSHNGQMVTLTHYKCSMQ